jgi:hypothetical protein
MAYDGSDPSLRVQLLYDLFHLEPTVSIAKPEDAFSINTRSHTSSNMKHACITRIELPLRLHHVQDLAIAAVPNITQHSSSTRNPLVHRIETLPEDCIEQNIDERE